MENKNIRQEEKDSVFKAGKQNPFKIPDGYFDKLPSIIQGKLDRKGVWQEVFNILLRSRVIASASLIMVLVIVGILYLKKEKTEDSRIALTVDNKISKQEIEDKAVIAQIKKEDVKTVHVESIEEDVVMDELEENILPEKEELFELENDQIAEMEKEEMDYLIQNADLSFLMEELKETEM